MKTKIVTTDIYLAAALLSLGNTLENVDKTDPRHMKFEIKQKNPIMSFTSENLPETKSLSTVGELHGLEYFESLWINASLTVNAVLFKNSIQQLKSLIHST